MKMVSVSFYRVVVKTLFLFSVTPQNKISQRMGGVRRIPDPKPGTAVKGLHDRRVLKKGLGQTRNGIAARSDHDPGITIRLPETTNLIKQSSGY